MEMTSNDFGLMIENCDQGSKSFDDDDRLSQLPDEILIVIISGLPLIDAGRTSVLSPRWRNLWKYTSRLNFEPHNLSDKIPETLLIPDKEELLKDERFNYMLWVTRILFSCYAPTLDEFRVRFDIDSAWQFVINMWLKHAFAKKVQRLELDLSSMTLFRDAEENCVFPEEFLAKDHPSPISIPVLNDIYGTEITFDSLRALSLKCVNVSGEALEFFLHNCPYLEELVVCGSDKLTNLEVSGPSLKLKLLEIQNCNELVSLKVCNTNLRSLTLVKLNGIILLEKLPMLVNVSITSTSTDFYTYVFGMLSSCLPQLEVLNLCGGKPKEIVKVSVFPDLTKLKRLVLRFWSDRNRNFLGLISFVNLAPLLEEFVLELMWFHPSKNEKQVEMAAATPHHFLKVVHISGYCGRIGELELVRYFLENAVALERIIVDPRRISKTACNPPPPDVEMANEQSRRKLVMEQLEGRVPEHIQLVVL